MELSREARLLINKYQKDYRAKHKEAQAIYYKQYAIDHKAEKKVANIKYWNKRSAAL